MCAGFALRITLGMYVGPLSFSYVRTHTNTPTKHKDQIVMSFLSPGLV